MNLKTLLALGEEYGWLVVIVGYLIWNSRQNEKFYHKMLSGSFQKLEQSISSMQEQFAYFIYAIVDYREGKVKKGDNTLRKAMEIYQKSKPEGDDK